MLAALLALAGIVHGAGLYRSPQPLDGEGSLVAQVWVSDHLAETAASIAPDGVPPLAWLQLTMWTELTGAFDRAPTAVAAGRELMVVVAVVSTALVWWVARRIPMPRWAAALAAACFALSPLAVEAHRTVSPENLATPWTLAAIGLLLGPRRAWAAVVSSALCLAVALLSSATALLLLPALVWVVWRTSPAALRRRSTTVWSGVLAVAGLLPFLVVLLVRGPAGAGVVPTAAGLGCLGDALRLDPVLATVALVVLPLALLQRRLRPLVLAVVLPLAVLVPLALATGEPALTSALVVLVVPVVSLLVAAVTRGLWRHRPSRLFGRDVRRSGGAVLLVAAATVLAVAVPSWALSLRVLATDDADRPLADATAWVGANVPVPDRVVTDAAAWLELVEQGRERDVVVGFRTAEQPCRPRRRLARLDALGARGRGVLRRPGGRAGRQPARGVVRRGRPPGRGPPHGAHPCRSGGPVGGPLARPPTAAPTPSVEPTPDGTAGPSQPPASAEPSPWASAAVLQLMGNPAIELGPQARLALRSGQVDDRLLSPPRRPRRPARPRRRRAAAHRQRGGGR